mmetsp:Transcript_1038/g.2188  ORF Transcript_1038/g.2188 Transcript_1038/m.2188 type:complete len:145 (-) Transcript_1038:679-1113(-)
MCEIYVREKVKIRSNSKGGLRKGASLLDLSACISICPLTRLPTFLPTYLPSYTHPILRIPTRTGALPLPLTHTRTQVYSPFIWPQPLHNKVGIVYDVQREDNGAEQSPHVDEAEAPGEECEEKPNQANPNQAENEDGNKAEVNL